ncbi:MAG: hypothetical protein ACE5QW_02330 [Thermoplasmata archaeon]
MLLRDALRSAGYTRVKSRPLRVADRTIAGTGTMRGSLLAENRPKEVVLPWLALRITGWAMILVGLVILIFQV